MRLVPKPREDLADFTRRKRAEAVPSLSIREVARRSGGLISHSYVSMIENRGVLGDGVSPKRLLGLARGLSVPLDDIIAVALGLPRDEIAAEQSRLIGFFQTLPQDKQRETLDWLQMLSRRYGGKRQKTRRTV